MEETRVLLFHLKSSRRMKFVGICSKNISAEIQLCPYRNYRILHVQYESLWKGGALPQISVKRRGAMDSCFFSFLLPLRLAGRPFLRRPPRPADSSPPPIGSVSHLFAFPPRASAPAGKRVHLLRAVGRVPASSHRRQSHSAPPFRRRRLSRHP